MNNISTGTNTSFLDQIREKQEKNLEKLSSGKKINSAADGAAAQQIIERLTAESNAYQQSIRNSYDGVSLAQTADGALAGIGEDTQRIRELTIQAGSGILTDADRQAIQSEISALQGNIQATIEQTQFNGQSLFTGDNEFTFQTGSNAGDTRTIGTSNLAAQTASLGLGDIDVTAPGGVASAIVALDGLSEFVSLQRGELGAAQNAFESNINNLSQANENIQASRSRIQDTDYAAAASENVANNVASQAASIVAQQSNQNAGAVLGLLG
ncbi:flagellin [Saccharobesus litoralis]|uniref:Flagellin n=1 Tax=Saccharobesus litoralis TaxID=2172099 RepID=A0A2S0VXU5_9ALTE|nr:flagellin [Saccharobesus litoralis]